MKRGHRVSLLDISQHCGLAPILSERYGAGRAAAKSSSFHALLAHREEEWQRLSAQLTEEEREEIMGYKLPTDFEICGGHSVSMDRAEYEVEVTLSLGDVECIGHTDIRFLEVVPGFGRVVVVIDAKRSEYTSHPDSLQLAGYGHASMDELQADAYIPAIWVLDEGEYIWGKMVESWSIESARIQQRLAFAALNEPRDGTGDMGPHCNDCWARLHCPEYLMPPELAETELGPMADPERFAAMENAEAGDLLLLAQRAKKTADAVIANLKAFAERKGGIEHGDKVWRPVYSKGREGIKLSVLRERYPDVAEELTERGAAFSSMRWTKKRG